MIRETVCSFKLKTTTLLTYSLAAVIFFSPLEMYRVNVVGMPLSISRFLLGVVIVLLVFFVFYGAMGFKRTNLNVILSLYMLVPLFFTICRASNFNLLNLIMGGALVFVIVHSTRCYTQHMILLRAFQLSYIWYIFFGFYTYYYFIINDVPPTDIPFRDILPFSLPEAGHIKRGFLIGAGSVPLPRLALPLATPPVTSMALALGVIMFFADKTLQSTFMKCFFRMVMLLLLLICLLLTMSKSGVLMFLCTMVFFAALHLVWYLSISKKVVVIFFVVSPILWVAFANLPIDAIALRLTSWEFMENTVRTHFFTRMEAISIASENVSRFLFGVGYGNYWQYGEGVHSHSPITTKLVELGIIGSFFFWSLYIYSIVTTYLCMKRYSPMEIKNKKQASLCFLYFIGNLGVLIGAIFYESLVVFPVFIFLALGLNFAVWMRTQPFSRQAASSS